jgi:hypothetical protein
MTPASAEKRGSMGTRGPGRASASSNGVGNNIPTRPFGSGAISCFISGRNLAVHRARARFVPVTRFPSSRIVARFLRYDTEQRKANGLESAPRTR